MFLMVFGVVLAVFSVFLMMFWDCFGVFDGFWWCLWWFKACLKTVFGGSG